MTNAVETTETIDPRFDAEDYAPHYTATLWVTDPGLTYLADRLAPLVKRAKRIKVTPPAITVHRSVAVASKGLKISRMRNGIKSHGHVWIPVDAIPATPTKVHLRHLITVTGEAPKLAGWKLLATLEGTDGGTLLRTVPGTDELLPAKYRTAKVNWCDHCQKRRKRTYSYVVAHEDGRDAQVGRSCLRDFLGHADPKRIANIADLMAQVSDEIRGLGEGGGRWVPNHYTPLGFLAATAMVIRKDGWASKKFARAYDKEATAGTVSRFLSPPTKLEDLERWEERFAGYSVTAADRARATAALEWAKVVDASDSDYLHNVKVTARMSAWTYRHTGIGASIVAAWLRDSGQKLELNTPDKRTAYVSDYFGTVGKRLEFSGKLVFHTSWPTDWGVTHLYKFETDAGGIAVWKAARSYDLWKGETYKLKATVKEHKEYNGTKQTVVQRAKVLERPKEEDEDQSVTPPRY